MCNPDIKVPRVWDFQKERLFMQFLGYWFARGYYEKFGVVVPGGKNIADLMPIFDSVSALFQCKYKIKENKLVRFDSAMLKYVMMGLHFLEGKKASKQLPHWIPIDLTLQSLQDFLKGYFTAAGKVENGNVVCMCNNPTIRSWMESALKEFYIDTAYTFALAAMANKNTGTKLKLVKDTENLQLFNQQIGFLSSEKRFALESILFVKLL
jgi:hypothetical protein